MFILWLKKTSKFFFNAKNMTNKERKTFFTSMLCSISASMLHIMNALPWFRQTWQCQQYTQTFNGLLSGTTRVGQYRKKHSPTHTHPDDRTSFIIFLHLQRSTASSLFSLRAWQSSRTTSIQVLFGLPLGLGPSTSYSMYTPVPTVSNYKYVQHFIMS